MKCIDTQRRKGEVKGKQANGVDSQYPSHGFGMQQFQRY